MSEFAKGVIWTVGMYLYGKAMYDIGQRKLLHDLSKPFKELEKTLKDIENKHQEEQEETESKEA